MTEVLLVMTDEILGEPIASSLESEGYRLMWCPGPTPPSYVCAGGRDDRCALAAAADVVVVDGWLQTDIERRGTPSWHLISYYRSLGAPVIALVGPHGLPGPIRDAALVPVPRNADPAEILTAVRNVLAGVARTGS